MSTDKDFVSNRPKLTPEIKAWLVHYAKMMAKQAEHTAGLLDEMEAMFLADIKNTEDLHEAVASDLMLSTMKKVYYNER